MITIKITDRSIRMNGHACRKSPDGIDRVCTAVSALTCNLINSLEDLTQFRIWATNILKEYMKKGFAMDDERLKNLGGGGYFKELFLTNRRWIKPQMNIENIRLKRSVMWNGII